MKTKYHIAIIYVTKTLDDLTIFTDKIIHQHRNVNQSLLFFASESEKYGFFWQYIYANLFSFPKKFTFVFIYFISYIEVLNLNKHLLL